jgi:SAM-dependent methyltransferase
MAMLPMNDTKTTGLRSSIDSALDVLRCTGCGASDFAVTDSDLRCGKCGVRYTIAARIIDGMPNPTADAVDELRGMMREMRMEGDIHGLMRRKVDRVSTIEARTKISENDGSHYYGSTQVNFRQMFARIPLTGRERVLEVGGDEEFPFLKPFGDAGCTCFATNLYFHYDDDQTGADWPVRVLGDMHDLPYRDGAFDIVFLSGTSHHSPKLDRAVGELARVTRPGGYVINVNEPIRGVLKHALSRKPIEKGKQDAPNRDELVHEHEYSIFEYLRAFRKNGLELQASLFADYYAQRLSSANVHGVRFAGVAKAVSRVWRQPVLRSILSGPGLWIGQTVVGLQMNVMLRKRG